MVATEGANISVMSTGSRTGNGEMGFGGVIAVAAAAVAAAVAVGVAVAVAVAVAAVVFVFAC